MVLNRIKVKIRKYKYIFYLKKTVISTDDLLNSDSYNNGFSIINFPKIKDVENFKTTLIKLKWYIALEANLQVTIFLNIDKNIISKSQKIISDLEYYPVNIISLNSYKEYNNYNIILLFKLSKFHLIIHKFSRWMKKSILLDPKFYLTTEGSNFRGLLYILLSDDQKEELLKNSKSNYFELMKKHGNTNRVNLFLTGPTLDTLYDFDFNKGINIICNSIVKNENYLKHIKPDILVFADPVYHYSYNKYSQQFLADVKNVILSYNVYCIVSERSLPLLYYHFPELRNRLIGIPIDTRKNFNFITYYNFYSAGGSSILPIFMLPTAAGLGDEIFLIGADGRQKSESFFWKHSSKAQYNDLMNDIKIKHPSFFDDRIYEDYYQEYCDNLERIISIIEKADKKVYSLSKSYIPVLKERYHTK